MNLYSKVLGWIALCNVDWSSLFPDIVVTHLSKSNLITRLS